MKKVLIVILLAGAGWIGFQSYQAGEFSLYAGPVSPEQARIRQLEKELDQAKARFKQAGRASAVSGMDTTGQADAAMQEIKRLQKELVALKDKVER